VSASGTLHAVDPLVRPRAGLGDLRSRLHAGECTLGYLGASVTAQRDGYRPRLHRRLCEATGHDHRSVFAGTGAMGSITGVFLMDDLVLAHDPDLCFVEYTTSDAAGTTPPEHLGPALEGIVCKLRDAGCLACFLHLYRSDHDLGGASPVLETYERVAEHHGVPSVDVGVVVRDLIHGGAVTADAVVRDVVHTTADGSELTADAIWRGLARVLATSRPSAEPEPRYAESFRRTRIVPATPDLLRDGTAFRARRFRLAYPYLELGSANDLRYTPDGDLVGLLVIVGPDAGFIEVETPGRTAEYLLWDEHCSYDRLASVVFAPFVHAGTPVTIRLSPRPVDYSRARRPIAGAASIEKRLKVVGLMVRP
jgi:hypothetical protein